MITKPIDRIFPGRLEAIKESRCFPPPIGCGKSATTFRDALSAKEYEISGLCQKCQDTVFAVIDDDDQSDGDEQ